MPRRKSRLQRELRQRKPFGSLRQEAAIAVVRTADRLRWRMARLVGPLGITVQQYNVLRILRGVGKEGLPTLEIARRMIERTPGITRLMDRLEAKRLVQRERCATDRRQVTCWITPQGLELLERLDQPLSRSEESALGGLAQGDVERLIDLLERIRKEVG
ncbi:MAG TPA: MarR family transcriptional regulator [Candidatus Eisenbacteria bacterium]